MEGIKGQRIRVRKTKSIFTDKRLDNQYVQLTEAIASKQHAVINRLSHEHRQQTAFYRFLSNEAVSEDKLIKNITNRCHVASKFVNKQLVIHDTTDFDFSWLHPNQKQSTLLGPIGNHRGCGYMAHVSLAVNAQDASLLGIAGLKLWSRPQQPVAKNNPYHTAFEQKESIRWIEGARQAAQNIGGQGEIIHMMDAEGDMYDSFVRIANQRQHLLIRSRFDRRIQTQQGQMRKLGEYIDSLPACASYRFVVNGQCHKKKKREAVMDIRFASIALLKSNNMAYQKQYAQKLEVRVVDVKERSETVPQGEKPIHWRLLTTLEIEDWTAAVEIVCFYTLRWLIEEFFRLLKKEGFNIEQSELGTAQRLRKITIIAMDAAIRVLQLKQARDGNSHLPIAAVFTPNEQQCLKQLLPKLEGKTQKQKNPHLQDSLAWATWIIARLGGWKGYASQRKPGVLTLQYGLKVFENILAGWNLANCHTYV